jgi:anaerobic ribonucleoside-triphosphate reductase activating protein
MFFYSHIQQHSFVDGPGERTVLFAQGYSVGRPGCQNKLLWPGHGGATITTRELARLLVRLAPNKNITLSGGEMLDQFFETYCVIAEMRKIEPDLHIILYTGRTYEWLVEKWGNDFRWIMSQIDVLVDGPFIASQDDALITWRGSRNQRAIDARATIKSGHVVTLDWDSPEIVVDADGNLHMPIGLASDFAEAGVAQKSRRCGETSKPELVPLLP